ncbi:MAG: rhodanese-related sulfurtransferase [Alphaproteobacteria bacterium]|nr:rhodanese-related sulfurtransferase [Alphaproteobacteria bacterium]
MNWKVAALYKFTPIADIPALRAEIYAFTQEHTPKICGTLLLAPEGVNGTLAVPDSQMETLIAFLDKKLGITTGELKYSPSSCQPFNRFKVREKKEIITLKRPEADPTKLVGQYVEPKDWNTLINDPDVILIDTRNDYETKVGIFEGAIDPKMKVFTEFPDWVEENLDPAKDKKIAMFCTGGIRCEKASAYMLAHGFENVYHLKGGILKYLETIPAEQSKWQGDCFVFDQRVAVGHALTESGWAVCHACREPLSTQDLAHPAFESGISCPHCIESLTPQREESLRARQKHYAEKNSKSGA